MLFGVNIFGIIALFEFPKHIFSKHIKLEYYS